MGRVLCLYPQRREVPFGSASDRTYFRDDATGSGGKNVAQVRGADENRGSRRVMAPARRDVVDRRTLIHDDLEFGGIHGVDGDRWHFTVPPSIHTVVVTGGHKSRDVSRKSRDVEKIQAPRIAPARHPHRDRRLATRHVDGAGGVRTTEIASGARAIGIWRRGSRRSRDAESAPAGRAAADKRQILRRA